ncbi:hypothetical protein SS50377_24625 [Spironucleus salmonicida]|uniref:Uncharacterized protein n=1 Tax=Spironucleus salmonicida TaxID=348837 RepID=V6LUP0_9EUKA|nr:hypothetical protein SS50377_24625 [Spironucleus salmonicida]|eukprot:EST44524.1 Hypothetical protein SS50377_15522 [Spironucleus salmonicida]
MQYPQMTPEQYAEYQKTYQDQYQQYIKQLQPQCEIVQEECKCVQNKCSSDSIKGQSLKMLEEMLKQQYASISASPFSSTGSVQGQQVVAGKEIPKEYQPRQQNTTRPNNSKKQQQQSSRTVDIHIVE